MSIDMGQVRRFMCQSSSTENRLKNLTISVVIPALNEERSIADVVRRVLRVIPNAEVLVVDDGSEDETAVRAEEAGAQVLRRPYTIGNGAAVKAGVQAAKGSVVVLLDGDGQHPPEEIPRLIKGIGKFDMVVAARTNSAPVSRFRRFGNRGLILLANYLAQTSIPDLTSGFRVVKRKALLGVLHLLPNKFSYPTTITLAFLKSGNPVTWVPMDNIISRATGTSKISPFRDGLSFIHIMLRIIMLFNPQRIFLPVSGCFLLLGVSLMVYNIAALGSLQEASLLLFIVGVFIFFFGLLADQIAHIRRELTRK